MEKEKLFYKHGMNTLDYMSLDSYVNTHESFKLKHIIEWCYKHPECQLADKLLLYIDDNNLSDLEREYVINSIPFNDFAVRGMEEEYIKYLGYSMY